MPEEALAKLQRFKTEAAKDADALEEQRDQANEDMRFVSVPGGQWEGFLETQFETRARLEFDTVSDFLNRTLAEWNNNRMGVEYKPDDGASDDDAELLTSIYRADFRDGTGKEAVDQAVKEALTCGYGAFHIRPVFEDDEDAENDLQRIIWDPIYNAYSTVFWDRSARRLDKRDAARCTLLTPFTKEAFEEQFPGKKPSSAYDPGDRSYLNFSISERPFYVATRYEVIKSKESVFIYDNLSTGEREFFDEKEHEEKKAELSKSNVHQFVRKRAITRRRVEMSRFSGEEFLEEPRRIAGKFIGVIPVYGNRSYVDGTEYYYGLVRKLKDPARVINVQMSQVVEQSATGGVEVPIFERSQVEADDIRAGWETNQAQAYKVIDAVRDPDGNIVSMGPIGYSKPPQISGAASTLLEFSMQFMQGATGGAPQDTLDPDASGKAIQALLKRQNQNTQPMFDNVAGALEFSGDVYQSIAEETYDSPRLIRTLSQDGTHGKETLFKAVLDEQTDRIIETNKLKGKKFRAYADVGPLFDSLREQTVEDLKNLISSIGDIPAGQDYMDTALAALLSNISGVGLDEIKQQAHRKMMLMGLREPQSDEDKEFIDSVSEPQEDPQEELAKAAARQQDAEAKSLEASTIQKLADAEKKQAETAKIEAETEGSQVSTRLNLRREVLGSSQTLQ